MAHPSGRTNSDGYAGLRLLSGKSQPKQTLQKGDVVKCQPGIEHWHGATPESDFTCLATTPAQKGRTIWLHKVSEEEYFGKNPPARIAPNPEQEIINLSKSKWRWMSEAKVDSLTALVS